MADARLDITQVAAPPRIAAGRLRALAAAVRPRRRGRRASRPGNASRAPQALDAAEQAALEQLGAADGYVTRWVVGREVARSLASRQLVVVASDYVLLTEAGRRALHGDPGVRG